MQVAVLNVWKMAVVTSEGVELASKVALRPLNVRKRSYFTGLCCFLYHIIVNVTGQKSITPRKS